MTNVINDEICLPGFGLPINHQAPSLFPTALHDDGHEAPLLTVREYTMMELMNRVTDKPNWEEKVFDDAITAKWKAEALELPGYDVSEQMVDWCIAESRYKASKFKETGFVEAPDGVFKSDIAISETLKQDLKEAAAPLEDVPEKDKDWHPDSDEQVLDLVHPSIYPLVYGQSRLLVGGTVGLEDCLHHWNEGRNAAREVDSSSSDSDSSLRNEGEGEDEDEDLPASDNSEPDRRWSSKFQWLPTDFLIPEGSGDVKAMSYINNLHPERHQALYGVIEKVVAKIIPLWNATLTPLAPQWKTPEPRILLTHSGYDIKEKPEKYECEDDVAYSARLKEWKDIHEEPEYDYDHVGEGSNESDIDFDNRYEAWRESRGILQPEPDLFRPPHQRLHGLSSHRTSLDADQGDSHRSKCLDELELVNLRKDFGKLQVIVKLANIHLNPEKPEYKGGSWHVEGQANESICASAIYYYSSANITESLLSFRQQVSDGEDLPYEQSDHRALETIYGFENEGPTIQELGSVVTCEGRLLTFPNVMQHRVNPFRLEDPSKPGHRRILALFLVDPHQQIISTSNVPCQQKDWWKAQVRDIGPLGRMPIEITEHILDLTDGFPFSVQTAKTQMLELMGERKEFVKQQTEDFENKNSFNLCEH